MCLTRDERGIRVWEKVVRLILMLVIRLTSMTDLHSLKDH